MSPSVLVKPGNGRAVQFLIFFLRGKESYIISSRSKHVVISCRLSACISLTSVNFLPCIETKAVLHGGQEYTRKLRLLFVGQPGACFIPYCGVTAVKK